MIDCSKCPNRGDCCGLIPFTNEFIEKHKDKFQVKEVKIISSSEEKTDITDDMHCIFLNRSTKRCTVYNDRPKVCRLYGVTDDERLACEFFKPNGNPRSEAGQKRPATGYANLRSGFSDRWNGKI